MVLFPFSPSFYKPKIDRLCKWRREIRVVSFVQCFLCSGRKNIQMHLQTTKYYEVCDFSNSAYVLNTLIFAFNTGIA